ncbi:Histidine kinase-, DNA gyrase B-, and HSP90-like ATPase [Alteromonadaceae bacterium Bs31]|nr:Histidine kinase-, DNA gyrase B-, and HSP90-like ATPase [Alteromonadaceae bacterium Bs31]
MKVFSLQGKVLVAVSAGCGLGVVLSFFFARMGFPLLVHIPLALAAALSLSVLLVGLFTRQTHLRINALQSGMLNLLDSDYSTSIVPGHADELDETVKLYNQVVDKLRRERQALYQRELLLDTVIQNSNLALLLTDSHQRIVYANSQASEFFTKGEAVQGLFLSQLMEKLPESIRDMLAAEKDGLFSLFENESTEVYHLSTGRFVLNAEQLTLYLFKQLTRDISQKEIETWKKVIRVISHELNNSLAPISSMANSGRLMLEKNQIDKLGMVFETITERSLHLQGFIEAYIRLAKLPEPNMEAANWHNLIARLQQHFSFSIRGELPKTEAIFDVGQIEQAIINLLKNAHESGSPVDDICLSVKQSKNIEICVLDRGKGINNTALENMLLPFYTTKPNGSGVGLPLCREIIEAHGGKLIVLQRERGGIEAKLVMPLLSLA